ncbi:MAG: tetratricopeptide repeat protein [Phycisphaerae bacterium]
MSNGCRVVLWSLGACAVLAGPAGAGGPPVKPIAPAGAGGATSTEALRVKASLAPLLQQGIEALAAQQYPAAREAFLDALAVDPRNVRALHGAAVAAWSLKDVARARDAFERALAVAGPNPDRALVLNAAAFNAAMRNNMRAVKLARDYLSSRQAELDEPVLNALGAALARASASERRNRFYADSLVYYEIANKRLESAKPGQKRFGAKWYPAAEADEKALAFASSEKAIGAQADKVALAEEAVIAAQAEVVRQEDLARRGEGLQNQYLLTARANLTAAQAAVEAAKKELEKTVGAVERPAFPELTAVALDDVKAPAVNPPTAVATGVARPATPVKPVTPPVKPAGTGAAATVAVAPTVPAAVEPVRPAKRRVTQYAAAFAVSPTHVITVASAVDERAAIQLQAPDGQTLKATLVRKDDVAGLALLKVEGRTLVPVALADAFAGGAVTCAAYPVVDLFNPVPQLLGGTGAPPKGGVPWSVSLAQHPRLAGSPVLVGKQVVGVCVAPRDADKARLPAVPLAALKAFAGADARPGAAAADPAGALLQVVATREVE